MRIIKSVIVSFSMYSKISMPQFEWKEEDMRYMLCFFPWIGAVIGICLWLWAVLCEKAGIGMLAFTTIGSVIPILITGGFHVDGFMDTMDAFHSYQPREKKLEILKDSHIGAFAVIMLAAYGLIYLGAFSEIRDMDILKTVCAGFVLSRALSGIAVVSFPAAKKDGLLYLFASNAQKKIVRVSLVMQVILSAVFMLYESVSAGTVTVLTAAGVFAYYYYRCKKELGGITGDTAGYFVVLCEGCMVIAAAIADICG